ncbi:MAG: hypothetical protein K2J47_08530 [Ruminococcus sp.]|nr:hypothetical protein [Ruminococcus sp.]
MRCYVRTNGDISANDICTVNCGGGHFHASCCELDVSPQKARKIMENTCKEFLLKSNE